MDRLTTFGLCCIFFLFGPGLTFLSLLILVSSGQVSLNYLSLFCLNALLTYSMNGFFGMLYMFVSSLIMISCGAMYWFDWSPSDLKNEISSLNQNQNQEIKYDELLANKNVVMFKEYVTKGTQKFYEVTGLTDDKIVKYKNAYVECSKKFDYFSDILWKYLCNFYEMTKDTKGFKEVYSYLLLVVGLVRGVDSIKNLHKLSRNLCIGPGLNPNPDLQIQIPGTDAKNKDNLMGQIMDPSSLDFNKMNEQFNNMSPGQKKTLDDMTKQMFENLNINDMMSMMQGFGNMMKPNNGQKNKKNSKK